MCETDDIFSFPVFHDLDDGWRDPAVRERECTFSEGIKVFVALVHSYCPEWAGLMEDALVDVYPWTEWCASEMKERMHTDVPGSPILFQRGDFVSLSFVDSDSVELSGRVGADWKVRLLGYDEEMFQMLDRAF